MRKALLALFAFLFVGPGFAQTAWGVRAGGAYSALIQKVGDEVKAGARFGYSIAAMARIPLYTRLSLRPEIAFVEQGGGFYKSDGLTDLVHDKCHYYAVQVPVNLQYTFPFEGAKFGVFIGPYVDFSLWGHIRTADGKRRMNFGSDSTDDLKPFDLGVNLGVNVEYSQFIFVIQALCGTLNRNPASLSDGHRIYQNNVTFSLGYMFRK